MNRTPIVILTKDNPEYLAITLSSLMATETFDNPVFIVDDCSETPLGRKFLYTDEVMDVTFNDWTVSADEMESTQETYDKIAGASYLTIPDIAKIEGIRGKYTVVQTPHRLGRLHGILFAMNLAFTTYPMAKTCAILDDDIMFNPTWLKEALKLYEYEHFKEKVGLVSVFAEKCIDEDEAEYYMNSVIRGKCVMATKEVYEGFKRAGLFRGIDVTGEGPSWVKLQKLAESLGFTCYTTRLSYIQSLKKRNLVNKQKVLMYDSNFLKPIAWSGSSWLSATID